MSREQLIEKARVAYVEAWEAEDARIENWDRDSRGKHTRSRAGIEAAFAVFEEAHTQTGERLRQARTDAATQHLRADKAEAQVRTAPADDEREALEDALRQEFEYRIRTAVAYGAMKGYRQIPSQVRADWIQSEISKAMSVARTRVLDGFRRTVQGEPTDAEMNEIALAVLGPSRTYDREGLRKALADFLSNRSTK